MNWKTERAQADATATLAMPGGLDNASARSAAASAVEYPFAINGRFLTQPTTGVQRYGREVTGAIDALLTAQGRRATILLPKAQEAAMPVFTALATARFGPLSGHAWEQLTLPSKWRRPMLNLCNTAPLLSHTHVVCIHDAHVFTVPDSYGTAFRRAYMFLQPRIAKRAVAVATVSKSAALEISRFLSVPASAITVLPNGHEHVRRWDASRSGLRGLSFERPFVLMIGSRAKHKNVDRIVGLANALDDLGLDLMIAGGSAAIFASVTSSHAPNVRWLGQVSDDDLALLFSRALCLAFPSLTEGFGLPVLEAMALRCPVVSSNRASLPEVCGSAALTLDPGDDAAWLRCFQSLKDSRSLRHELQERGVAQALRFSWRASAAGYLDLVGH